MLQRGSPSRFGFVTERRHLSKYQIRIHCYWFLRLRYVPMNCLCGNLHKIPAAHTHSDGIRWMNEVCCIYFGFSSDEWSILLLPSACEKLTIHNCVKSSSTHQFIIIIIDDSTVTIPCAFEHQFRHCLPFTEVNSGS